jgi:hypothetical protein
MRNSITLTTKFKQYLEEIFDKVPTGGEGANYKIELDNKM